MLLCIDLGNTNITLGLYEADDLHCHWRINTDHHKMADEYGMLFLSLLAHAGHRPQQVTGICLCSVVPPLTGTLEQMCDLYFQQKPLIVDVGVKTGVKIRYDNPREVGADRVVDAAAVYRLYGGPACIVDFGTATTFDAISPRGEYLGGAICPGIGISAEALFQRAAKLPRVEISRPRSVIGRTTVGSMQAGLYFGYLGLVEGLVRRMREELGGGPVVVATGGQASLLLDGTGVVDHVDPFLTLTGLRILYDRNR